MQEPLISIIIPIYNVEKYLVRCLESVINQTYKKLEILLIDDGSTDTSGQIADEYVKKDSRFQVFHLSNQGVSHARNVGLEHFHGEYITFIDADDFILESYIQRLYDAIVKCNVKHSICLPCDTKSEIVDRTLEIPKIITINIKQEFDYSKSYAYGTVWGSLYHKSLVENVFFSGEFYVGEDEVFFAEVLLKNDTIAFIDEKLYIHMIYEQSASYGVYDEKKKTNIFAWDCVQKQFLDYPIQFQSKVKARCCISYLQAMKLMKKSNYYDKNWFYYVLKKARYTLKDLLYSSYSNGTKISAVLYCMMPNLYGNIHKKIRK